MVTEAIQRHGLPWLEARSDDEALRDLLLSRLDELPLAHPAGSLLLLRDLVDALGPDDAPERVVREMERRP